MFDQVVLAGGGNRCWWQAGVWERIAGEIGLAPRVVVGISAGAATGCMLYTRDPHWVMDYYARVLADNHRNIYWDRLFKPGQRMLPHAQIYRQALLDIYEDRMDRLRAGPELRIGLAHIPRWLGPRSAVAAGLIAYNIEKYLRRSLHPRFGRALGFQREFVRAQDCADPQALADLVLQSSSTPPFTPVLRRDGRVVLDGGLVDNVPVDGLDATPGRVLVLITRRYPRPPWFRVDVPVAGGVQTRIYLQPSVKVPIASWDYTRPGQMRPAYDLGWRDGGALLGALPSLLGPDLLRP